MNLLALLPLLPLLYAPQALEAVEAYLSAPTHQAAPQAVRNTSAQAPTKKQAS